MPRKQGTRSTVVRLEPVRTLKILIGLGAACLSLPAAGDDAPPPSAQALIELMAKAANSSVASRFERQRLETERSQYELAATVNPASIELQSEGLDSSLDREINALDSLRLVKPTAAPWHSGARRDFRRSLADWHQGEAAATSISVGADVALLWLDLAAAEAESSLRRARLERVERALNLFETRYRLGEVAGTDVRQLEAQRADDRIALTEIELQVSAEREALVALLGFEPRAPTAGSLSELSLWLSGIETSDWQAPTLQAERIEARAELASDLAELEERTAAGQPSVLFELERIPSMSGMSSVDAFGVQISLPLPFGRSVEKRRAAARAQGALADAEAEVARSRLDRDLNLRRTRSAALARELTQLDPVVGGMAETEHSLNEQFRLGAISYLVFLDGVARLDDVRLRHIELQRRHVQSRIELGQLTGDSRFFPLPSPVAVDQSAASDRPGEREK